MNRREFIARAGAGLGVLGLGNADLQASLKGNHSPPILVFSKHLQHHNYRGLAETAAAMGFDGIDLTVRPGGHVKPSRVTENLPEAVEAIRACGLREITMSTKVLCNEDGHDRAVLETAEKLSIKQYRIGSTRYTANDQVESQFEKWRDSIREVARLNDSVGILGAVQNHSQYYIGGLIWDLWMAIKNLSPKAMACHFDVCHAVAEAAISWPVGFKLLQPRISALVVKDFQFTRDERGINRRFVPLGTGMVPWEQFWPMYRTSGLRVPIIVHMEYADRQDHAATEDFLKKDLQTLKSMLAGTWTRQDKY